MRNRNYILQQSVKNKVGDMHLEMTTFTYKSKESYVQQDVDGVIYGCIRRIYETTINTKELRM